MIGTIKVNKHTVGHQEKLQGLGYEVEEVDEKLEIQCEGFHDASDEVDATTQEKLIEFFQGIKEAKLLVPYTTRFNFGEGKVLSAPFNLSRLGELSCMVATSRKAPKTPKGPKINQL